MTPAARSHNLATLDSCLVRQRVQLLPATKAPPPPPPSAFPWDAKRKLAIALSNLNMDHSYGVIEILQSCGALGAEGEGELRIDLDAIPNPVLQKLAVRLPPSPSHLCDASAVAHGSAQLSGTRKTRMRRSGARWCVIDSCACADVCGGGLRAGQA